MACIVTGFPSQIAALQFEWAWQNPHLTLHIPPALRLTLATQKKRLGHPKRPRHTITSLLSNLHLLLRVPSFSRWPLEVRFFAEDVHKAWVRWSKQTVEPLRDALPIILDFPSEESGVAEDGSAGEKGSPRSNKRKISHGIAALDVDYTDQKAHVEKGKDVIDFEREGPCAVCHDDLEHQAGVYAICPNPGCETVTHLTCLSKHFLKGEENALVPIRGVCPTCETEIRWVDVVKELSLRMRGQKEVEKLLKEKRVKKGNASVVTSQEAIELSGIEDAGEDLGDLE